MTKENPMTLLTKAMAELKQQKTIYQPTAFWAAATEIIAQDVIREGVEDFRRLPKAMSYFVPLYSGSASGINNEQAQSIKEKFKTEYPDAAKSHQALDYFFSGKQAALADYRILLASENNNNLPRLNTFSESQVGNPIEQFEWNGHHYSRSSLNYLLGLSFLKQHLGGEVPRTVLEIGGGFGTLGEIWSQVGIDNWKYIDIDIPPTQFVADYYLKSVLGHGRVTGFDECEANQEIHIDQLKPASVLCSWQIEQLKGEVDLFVNFISFQEMEPDVVQNYLHHVDRLKSRWVLMRNMREGKQIQKVGHVGVKNPIQTNDYINMLPNYRLVASNLHPFGFETVDGFHSELLVLKRN